MSVYRTLIPVVVAACMALGGCASSGGSAVSLGAGAAFPGRSIHEVSDAVGRGDLRRENSLGLGLNAEFGLFRATLAYATGATISERGVGNGREVADGTVLALAGDVVLRPLPRVLVQPYGLGGLGFKRQAYSFRDDAFRDVLDGRSDFIGHFGLGADAALGPLGIFAEYSNFVTFRSGAFGRNDSFLLAGLQLRF
jgi:hypothetical protein